MSALTDLFTAMANKIRSKTGGSDTYTPPEMVDAIDDVYDAGVAAGTTPTQTKSVTAGTSQVTVTPDAGYALSSVTVNPTPTETGSATPTTSAQTVSPSSGKYLSSVSVGAIQIDSTNNSATATTSQTTKSPDTGKYFSSFTINPQQHSSTYTPAANTAANDMGAVHNNRYVNTSGMIVPSGAKSITANGTGIDVSSYATANVNVPNPTLSGDAATGNVLSGKTFYNNSYTKQTGSMTDRTGWTSTGNNCNASSVKDVTIPAGYHNGSGYVRFNSLSSQTAPASGKTAVDASHMHSGYSGWVNGAQVNGTYTEPTINNITPSNTSPVALTANNNYKPSSNGFAIENYASTSPVTPGADGDGAYFASGWNRMTAPGYAYANQQAAPTITTERKSKNATSSASRATATITLSGRGYLIALVSDADQNQSTVNGGIQLTRASGSSITISPAITAGSYTNIGFTAGFIGYALYEYSNASGDTISLRTPSTTYRTDARLIDINLGS